VALRQPLGGRDVAADRVEGDRTVTALPPPVAPAGDGGRRPAVGVALPHPVVYAVYRLLTRLLVALLVRPEVVGRERVPRTGPLLVVANHLAFFDPPLILATLPRRITFLALDDLFRTWWMGPTLRLMGALPVQRGARDVASIRAALGRLGAGEAVGIFPEGGRSRQAALLRANPGAALLVVRAGAPVLPVAITGVEHLESPWRLLTARFRGRRVRVVFGRPCRPAVGPGRHDHQAIADVLMAEVAALLPAAYRGVYAMPGDPAGGLGDAPAAR